MATQDCYEFDGFRVDTRQRILQTLPGGARIDLQPRVFDALLLFVERTGELLGKRELMQALWPNVIVEENSLNQVVSQLRKALGERPSEHRYIVTSPGRGYRFVAAVHSAASQPPALHQRHPLSLAVLPFTDRTAGGTPRLGEAIAADLTHLLSARSRLRVVAHTSSAALPEQQQDPRRVGELLNVARIVSGEITGDARQLAVAIRLIDALTGSVLWSHALRGAIGGLAELQGDLARQLAQVLDPESAGTPTTPVDVAPDAYLDYLKALSLSQRPSPEGVAGSIRLLQQAIALSPQFPRARSLLAIQHTMAVMFGFASAGALQLAREEAAQALSLDDQNGETWCAAGVIDCLGGNWVRAEERFRIAHSLTADPLVSGLRCAYLTLSVGQLARAMQQAEYTLQVAPTHPIGVQMLAMLHLALGNDAAARRFAQLSIEQGQSRTMAPLTDLFALLALRAGQPEELARISAQPPPAGLDPPMRKRLILWHSWRGALDEAYAMALDSLDHYAREGTVGGAWGVLWLPEMQSFRDDERFQLFARRLRLFEYWSEYGPPDGYSLAGERLVRAG
jgi:DNA-binding winged helix-turn-helix (wHTH) protein/Tfp pilus assembly protein PilF